ncbi:MAG: PHB depolymerase family esterase [Pseudomonadota bacterium]
MGSYHIAVPEAPAGPVPAIMFLHGAGGSGASSVRPGGMARVALERGYAVIGPNGMDRPGRFGTGWSFHPDRPKQRDEMAFLTGVRDDAASRFGIDRDRVILAGFSIGGSMASYIACTDPAAFAAFAPVAGSFWRPHPEDCAGAVRLLHTHGWRDRTVPLEGRPLGGGRIYQGDVWHAMLVWRAENGCDGMRADTFETEGRYWIRRWDACTPGTALEFALHPGGHGIPQGWAAMTIDWFESLTEPATD